MLGSIPISNILTARFEWGSRRGRQLRWCNGGSGWRWKWFSGEFPRLGRWRSHGWHVFWRGLSWRERNHTRARRGHYSSKRSTKGHNWLRQKEKEGRQEEEEVGRSGHAHTLSVWGWGGFHLCCSTHVCFCVWSYFTYAPVSCGGEGWPMAKPFLDGHRVYARDGSVKEARWPDHCVHRPDGSRIPGMRWIEQTAAKWIRSEQVPKWQKPAALKDPKPAETSSGFLHALLAWPRGRAKRHRRIRQWLSVLVFVCVRGRYQVLLGIIEVSYD